MQKTDRYKHLFRVIDEIHPVSIMEIGVWNGNHAKQMIERAKQYKLHIRYYGFDLFEDITADHNKKENPVKAKIAATFQEVSQKLQSITGATIDLYRGYTHQTLPKFRPLYPIDFIFIDGGHSLETIDNDWLFCSKLIHEKSVILLDDYYPDRITHGCKPLIDRLQQQESYKYDISILEPLDVFAQPDQSVLKIQMVQVSLRDGL